MTAAVRLAHHLQDLTRAEMATVSNRAGVLRMMGARARAGRKVSATVYMLLCSATGLDAATGTLVASAPRAGCVIVWSILGAALLRTRGLRQLSLRVAADLIGVSAATLSRAERSHPIAVDSFLQIVAFIGMPAESFLRSTCNTNCNTLEQNDFGTTMVGATT